LIITVVCGRESNPCYVPKLSSLWLVVLLGDSMF
jgi:hypothetical protein